MRPRLGWGRWETQNRAPAILAPAKQIYYYSLYYKANFSSGSWNEVLGNPSIGFLGRLSQRGNPKLLYYTVNFSLQRVCVVDMAQTLFNGNGADVAGASGRWSVAKKLTRRGGLNRFLKVDTPESRLGFAWRLRSTFRERCVK